MQPRILIAEDDDIQGTVLRTALERQGYAADVVPDGLQALRRLRTGSYDLALLDYRLPEIDGLATARLLRDFLGEAHVPQLIAVTSAAEELGEREDGERPFNAVISKHLGLPTLLATVDSHLTLAAGARAAATFQRGHDLAQAQRRRLLAPLAAVPAVTMVAAFIAAISWTTASLHHVDATSKAELAAIGMGADTSSLVDAVQDTETSQRDYLLTGSAAHREAFAMNQQRVDRLLIAPGSASVEDQSGYGAVTRLHGVVEGRMRTLADEARGWHAPAPGDTAPALSAETGRETTAWLRLWATHLVDRSQQAMFASVAAIRQNMLWVVIVLFGGLGFAMWSGVAAVLRQWKTI